MNKVLLLSAFFASSLSLSANVTIQTVDGWFEGGYVTWLPVEEAIDYHVYYKSVDASEFIALDAPLVRDYASYCRADVTGLPEGQYLFKIVPVDEEGEMTALSTETEPFQAASYDRSGFAHFKTASSSFNPSNGVGAYQNNGALKPGAKVLYVHAGNASSIQASVITDSKGSTTEATGLQSIIDLYQKGYDKTPLDIRIIGTLRAEDMDHFSSSEEGLQIKGRNAYSEMNITIEGIGNDATIHGFGFLIRNACSIELRNLAIMWCMDDAVSMDTDNSNLWVHNLDLFYGKPGSDSDQKKGDGTLDIKGDSKYSTISYNHLWDSGKSSLCGMTSESGPNFLTYHHNWFDHTDSRHPRIRTMSVHVYNNYFDGNCKYGVGATTGSDVFVENNYFRNCKYPMLTSKQGSDVHNGVGTSDETKGTFSGEDGGSIKAFGNYMVGQKGFQPYVAGDPLYSVHFDAVVVDSRNSVVPNTITALKGGDTYSNFDTDAALMYADYRCDEASAIPDIVQGKLGAGRCQHGDFTWHFDNATEDSNDAVIVALSSAVQNYQSSWKGFFARSGNNEGGNGDDHPGDDDDPNGETFEGTEICHFTGNRPSSGMVTVTGNYSNSKGSVSYAGKTYSVCVKMESSTQVRITPTAPCTVTLIFGGSTSAAGQAFKLDGTSRTLDSNGQFAFSATSGTTYTLTKDKSINLFLIVFQSEASDIAEVPATSISGSPYRDLQGRIVAQPQAGRIYIHQGKRIKY
jgi:pectate lyase